MDENIRKAERRDKRGHRLLALTGLVVAAILGASWVGLFGFLSANSAFGTVLDLQDRYIPDVRPMELDLPDLSRVSRVYTADEILLGILTERNSQPVPLSEMPELVINTLLAAEDADFFVHEGIDFSAIARAAMEDLGGGQRQGGSTITQQVVKQHFVGTDVSLERKAAEAVIAAELERRYTKEEILEFYMNSVFFGANAYGVKAAAQEYFGKDLEEVTLAEAAAMVTPIRNPSLYDLRRNPEVVRRARNAVIDNMVDEGLVSEFDARLAKAEPVRTVPRQEFEQLVPQVVSAVNQELLNNPERYNLGSTYTQAKRAIFGCPAYDTECEGGGGLTVTVTLDFDWQQRATELLQKWFPPGPDGPPTSAIGLIDNRTGAIKVMAGALEFGEDLAAGQRPYDLAGEGRQNPGSAFKPIGLAAALENGWTLNSYWDWTSPQILEFPGSTKPWTCNNFSRSGEGIRTLESALVASTNTVFCQVSLTVGPEKVAEMARRLGVRSQLNPVPSIIIGSQAVTPVELAAAYSTFANHGIKREAYLVERIVDDAGNVLYQHEVEDERVLEEALAAAVVNTMEKVVQFGTATRANIGRPQAGKTGTHQSLTDVWFVGFIPQYTAGVWVGHADEQKPLRNITVNGEFVSRASSSRIPAPLWAEFMRIITEGLPVEDFPPDPPGIEAYYATQTTEVPDISGLSGKAEIKDAMYKAGLNVAFVEQFSPTIPEGRILGVSPSSGSKVSQGRTVTVTISGGTPPTATMPSVVGLTKIQADQEITVALKNRTGVSINWRCIVVPDAKPALDKRVIRTVPAAGAQVTHLQTTVELYVGNSCAD